MRRFTLWTSLILLSCTCLCLWHTTRRAGRMRPASAEGGEPTASMRARELRSGEEFPRPVRSQSPEARTSGGIGEAAPALIPLPDGMARAAAPRTASGTESWIEEDTALLLSLRDQPISRPARDAIYNPQNPNSPVESWITEVLTLARTSLDERIRTAALRVLSWNVISKRDPSSSGTYLRLFEDATDDSSPMVRQEALRGLEALWQRAGLDAAQQSLQRIADTHSDQVMRGLASRSLRAEAWPSGQVVTRPDEKQTRDWKAILENAK